MKIKNLILLIPLFLMGSQVISSQSKTGDLPVLDFSKDYPKKEIRLQDIADIEYISLETTDDLLLSGEAALSSVSDKYILVYEPRLGDVFVFNRNGKIYSHFNHKGQSGQEHLWISAGAILDEKNDEIFVCSQSIQVYSLRGEYKRTLKINTIQNEMKVLNFSNEALLIYEDVNVDPYVKSTTKEKPYSLISKKDGSLISVLDIHLPKRYSTRMHKELGNNRYTAIILYFPQSMYYGQDLVIADISSDTLYQLTPNKKLTPLLTRKPSVHTSEPRTVWTTQLTTDKFIIIGLIAFEFNSKGGKFPMLMYEFETGKISNVSFLYTEENRGKWSPGTSPSIAKNSTAELIQAQSIIDTYRLKRLKGNFEKLATTLSEDDNPVVRIITFK